MSALTATPSSARPHVLLRRAIFGLLTAFLMTPTDSQSRGGSPLPPALPGDLEPEVCELPAPLPPCDQGAALPVDVVRSVSGALAARHIPYSSGNLADCSGMAHRVLKSLVSRCEDVLKPTLHEARSAAAMAAWYQGRGRLKRTPDLDAIDQALVPGAIAFFSAPHSRSKQLNQVHHIGFILEVERDADGKVLSYTMFHGRSPGIPAGITTDHSRSRSPALGNGRESLVAVAYPSAALLDPDLLRHNQAVAALDPLDHVRPDPMGELEWSE
jgi:hypothetical protein